MKYFLVCNPGSRNNRGKKLIEAYRKLLDKRAVDYTCGFTSELEDATKIASEAISAGFKTVVAVGGDGTINRVLNGFYGKGNSEASASLGVLYSGTSPDFCRFHRIPLEKQKAVDSLVSGTEKKVDVCRIEFSDENGTRRHACYASSTNIGLGPGVAGRSNRYRKAIGDFAGTLSATVVSIFSVKYFDGVLTIDAVDNKLSRVLNVTIGKNPYLASGLKLGVQVTPSDGKLFVFALKEVKKIGLLSALHKAYSGSITGDDRFLLSSGETVSFKTDASVTGIEFDGDPAGFCPVKVTVMKQSLTLLGVGE